MDEIRTFVPTFGYESCYNTLLQLSVKELQEAVW